MKKYFETTPNFDGLKERIIILKDGEDKKTLFAVIALVTAVLIAVTVGVVYLLKTKMDDEYEEDWDYDWDDLEEDFFPQFIANRDMMIKLMNDLPIHGGE